MTATTLADYRAQVDHARQRLAELYAQRQTVEQSPLPLDRAVERVEGLIKQEAKRYRETLALGGFLQPDSALPSLDGAQRSVPVQGEALSIPVTLPTLCFFLPEVVRQRLAAALQEHLDGVETVTPEEKAIGCRPWTRRFSSLNATKNAPSKPLKRQASRSTGAPMPIPLLSWPPRDG